jgi:hypothetical protein
MILFNSDFSIAFDLAIAFRLAQLLLKLTQLSSYRLVIRKLFFVFSSPETASKYFVAPYNHLPHKP